MEYKEERITTTISIPESVLALLDKMAISDRRHRSAQVTALIEQEWGRRQKLAEPESPTPQKRKA